MHLCTERGPSASRTTFRQDLIVLPPGSLEDAAQQSAGFRRFSRTASRLAFGTCLLIFILLFLVPLILCVHMLLRPDTDDGNFFHHDNTRQFSVAWLVIFLTATFAMTVLMVIRRNQHPLRARTPVLLVCFVLGATGMATWAALTGPSRIMTLSCAQTHWVQNIAYPCFILPYFFRAERVIRVFAQARKVHDTTVAKGDRSSLSKSKSKRNSGIIQMQTDDGQPLLQAEEQLFRRDMLSFTSVGSNASARTDRSEMEAQQLAALRAEIADWANEWAVFRRFGLILLAFVMVSVLDTVLDGGTHFLPAISASGCDMIGNMKYVSIIGWTVLHLVEACIFLYYYRLLSTVLKEFHTRQEFVLVFFAEVLFTVIFVGLLLTQLTNREITDSVDYVVMSRSAILICISVVWPVYATYFGHHAPLFPNRMVVKSLEHVLTDPLALKHFHEYLQTDDNLIFLQFWMEVDMFKGMEACESDTDGEILNSHASRGRLETGDSSTMRRNARPNLSAPEDNNTPEARRIFVTYFTAPEDLRDDNDRLLNENGEEEIDPETLHRNRAVMKKTVPVAIIRPILEEIKRCEQQNLSVTCDIFHGAQATVFDKLQDSHHLFLRSQECKDLLYHLNGQEQLFRSLIEYNVI